MGTPKPGQNLSLSQMVSHPNFKHFIAYAISYTLFGASLTIPGPMFPFLAESQHRIQTQFSFLFVCRAIGFVTGSIAMRLIGHRFYLHHIIGAGVAAMSFLSLVFAMTNSMYLQGAILLIASIGCSFQDIGINLAAMDCFKGENMAVWLQIIHGALGIGGLLGPFIVYVFQLNAFFFLGLVGVATISFYWYLQTPQKLVDVYKLEQQDSKKLQLPNLSIYLICAGFLFAVGQQASFGGWISSYAVLWKFSTKEHATFYSSIYWISITFFRFILAGVKGAPTPKIKWLGIIGVISTAIGYFCTFHINSQFGLVTMSILYGLCNSVLFPLLLTIPEQFGFELTLKQSSLFLMWASLGQGCLAVTVGKTMQWFSYNWLLYGICFFNVAIYVIMVINTQVLTAEKEKMEGNGTLLNKFMNEDQKGDFGGYEKKNTIQSNFSVNMQLKQINK